MLSSADRVSTGTWSFASVILKVAAVPGFATAPALSIFSPTDNTQFSVHVNDSSTFSYFISF